MENSKDSIRYIKIFFIVLFVAAIISLSYKLIVSVANSSFKNDTFNLLVITDSTYLIHIDKDQPRLMIFEFPNSTNKYTNASRIRQSLTAGVPIDGTITYKNGVVEEINTDFMNQGTMLNLLFNPNNKRNNVNEADIVKMYFATKGMASSDKDIKVIEKPTSATLSQSFESTLLDSQIFADKKSVQVINATGVDGLGTKVADMLRSVGYNVVSIDNGDDAKSKIKAKDLDSLSVKRLNNLFNLPVVKGSTDAIADITIVLAKDIRL